VAAAVEQECSNDTSTDEGNGADSNKSNGPGGEQVSDHNISLLVAVAEVVVSGADVVEVASGVHGSETSVEVGTSSVQFHAVVNIGLDVTSVSTVGSEQGSVRHAQVGVVDWLVEHGHSLSVSSVGEHLGVGIDPAVWGGNVLLASCLNDVASVSLVSSFSSISGGVLIATSPLEVDVVVVENRETLGNKVILRGRVGLHDVSSLSAHI